MLADRNQGEFTEDCALPIRVLKSAEDNDTKDKNYAYSIRHIDLISQKLGIPWEPSKDVPFFPKPMFMGFEWDLDQKMVTLSENKQEKYIDSIKDWTCTMTHTLEEVQSLHGHLSHAALVIPAAKPPPIPIPLYSGCTALNTFSDASSNVGLTIIIGNKWHAWRLHQSWKCDEHDIRWAESITFEFLVRYMLTLNIPRDLVTVYGNNQGVISAWQKGSSRNKPTNYMIRWIHKLFETPPCKIFTKYIPSKHNLANGPSRGIYPPPNLHYHASPSLPSLQTSSLTMMTHAVMPLASNISFECISPLLNTAPNASDSNTCPTTNTHTAIAPYPSNLTTI
ncbi:hypothetical protein ID866_10463 [Astraeus odoratus]|nr:hypothetical protein ID866_10463 [Astraeus odoratus]